MFFLDRTLLESIVELETEGIEARLVEYEEGITKGHYPKTHKRYRMNEFKDGEGSKKDIQSDVEIFSEIQKKIRDLDLADEDDPKTKCLLENVKARLAQEPARKIVIFSEYVDTVRYL